MTDYKPNLRQLADSVECPVCLSPANSPCSTPLGRRRKSPHNERYRLAQSLHSEDGRTVIAPNTREGGFPIPIAYPGRNPPTR